MFICCFVMVFVGIDHLFFNEFIWFLWIKIFDQGYNLIFLWFKKWTFRVEIKSMKWILWCIFIENMLLFIKIYLLKKIGQSKDGKVWNVCLCLERGTELQMKLNKCVWLIKMVLWLQWDLFMNDDVKMVFWKVRWILEIMMKSGDEN